MLDEYCVLQSGSALGRGCGPLLIGDGTFSTGELKGLKVAIPGAYTTAALLFRMFLPECTNLVEMRFEQIIDSVRKRDVAAGVIIHESRFTYQQEGLVCLQDLGQWWEELSGLPIPLGCIAARRSLGGRTLVAVDRCIRESLEHAWANPGQSKDYISCHAQETDPEVVRSHIALYVNDFSIDLGIDGRAAVETFISRGRKAGILPESKLPIFCGE